MAEKRFLLLYGSQTGQAQAIAEEIRDRAVQKGLRPDLCCLSQSEKKVRVHDGVHVDTGKVEPVYYVFLMIIKVAGCQVANKVITTVYCAVL